MPQPEADNPTPVNAHAAAPARDPATPAAAPLADVQSTLDTRNIRIDQVGIRDLRHPIVIQDQHGPQHTIAQVSMSIGLPATAKGAHMSRFVEVLNQPRAALSLTTFPDLLTAVRDRLDATHGRVQITFPYFITKTAPISHATSLLDYEVSLHGEFQPNAITQRLDIVIPVTSLCPCSKAIANYGAHNQRSHVTIKVTPQPINQPLSQPLSQATQPPLSIADLIATVESQASAELYGLLKRNDEKFLTEHAYDNPKFVEDIVRDIAAHLATDPRIAHYHVLVENFESIHNHTVFAEVSG